MTRALVGVGIVVLVAGGISGCSTDAAPCDPAPLQVSAERPSAGSTITVSSAAAGCDLGLGQGATYSVSITAHGSRSDATEASVHHDGSFSVDVLVPADLPTGRALVDVRGAPLHCPADASCPGYVAPITIRDAR